MAKTERSNREVFERLLGTIIIMATLLAATSMVRTCNQSTTSNPTPPNPNCIYLGGEVCTINASADVTDQQMRECAMYCINSHPNHGER